MSDYICVVYCIGGELVCLVALKLYLVIIVHLGIIEVAFANTDKWSYVRLCTFNYSTSPPLFKRKGFRV